MALLETIDGHVEVCPGVIDHAALHAYTRGQCGALARALHQHTGWPMIFALYLDRLGREQVHVLVERPDGCLVDITGAHPPDEVRSRLAPEAEIDLFTGSSDALDELINEGVVLGGDRAIATSFVPAVLAIDLTSLGAPPALAQA